MEFNELLRTQVPMLRDELGVAIYLLDAERDLSQVIDNPTDYGLVNVTDLACSDCLNSDSTRNLNSTVVENPDEYLQWDGHLSARGNEIMAQFALETFNVTGDLDKNGGLGSNDIDVLTTAIRTHSTDANFDLNTDGQIDSSDRDFWVGDLAKTATGDANLDGEVGFDDFLSLAASFGVEGGWSQGNFTLDTEVGFNDFLLLSQNFGFGAASQVSEVSPVPEPSSLGLLMLATSGFLLWSRRRKGFRPAK